MFIVFVKLFYTNTNGIFAPSTDIVATNVCELIFNDKPVVLLDKRLNL